MPRILIVDDDPFARHLLADIVRALGHEASAAADAREALVILSTAPHACVIADVRMPGWDGIELARRIALLTKGPPVALTSAESDFDVHEEALRRGVRPAAFLHKPFNRETVGRVLRAMLDSGAPAAAAPVEPVPARRDVSIVPVVRDEHPEWLARVRGTTTQLPPIRMWFVAWRRKETGSIVVSGDVSSRIRLNRGQVVDVAGVRGLVCDAPAIDGLSAAIAPTLAGGIVPELGLTAIAQNLAHALLSPPPGEVCGEPGGLSSGHMLPLPGTVPALLAHALAGVSEAELVARWQPMLASRLTSRLPDDVPPERLALDAAMMRAHRSATGQTAQALLYELSGGNPRQRAQVLRTMDLLLRLNLYTRGVE